MGTLKSFFESKGLTAKHVAITSRRIEAFDDASKALMGKRATKRRTKEQAEKKYAELGIEKPKQMGRGVSEKAVNFALADKPVARKVRAKILRAVNVILAKKSQPAADMKALFEGTKARAGKKAEAAAAKK